MDRQVPDISSTEPSMTSCALHVLVFRASNAFVLTPSSTSLTPLQPCLDTAVSHFRNASLLDEALAS